MDINFKSDADGTPQTAHFSSESTVGELLEVLKGALSGASSDVSLMVDGRRLVLNEKKVKSESVDTEKDGAAASATIAVPAAGCKAGKSTPTSSDNNAECESCEKFSSSDAVTRLHAVHAALQRDFSQRLAVSSVRCDHLGKEHVHVFTVRNFFDATSLGAISTVYSRTKPRLPRRTRIHIVYEGDADAESMVDGLLEA